ncbi:54S ribosomal protein img2, mitochondrial [Friedmanniomyces endolithicus]|nr:54S ribosomal protein img2, mitochondrial [Friedmanniomyces endolithicus]
MAPSTPLLSFLRPLGLPRPSTIRHFLRFTPLSRAQSQQASPPYAARLEDPNLRASRSASASYPPKSLKSLPRPKESRASRLTNYPRAERAYPTRHLTHSPIPYPKLIPDPVSFLPTEQCAPNLAYFVTRTPSKELPVYQLTKRGGNMKLTRIRKIDGRPETLRDALRVELNLGDKEAVVNAVTRQVVLKGFWKKEVDLFLRRRMF